MTDFIELVCLILKKCTFKNSSISQKLCFCCLSEPHYHFSIWYFGELLSIWLVMKVLKGFWVTLPVTSYWTFQLTLIERRLVYGCEYTSLFSIEGIHLLFLISFGYYCFVIWSTKLDCRQGFHILLLVLMTSAFNPLTSWMKINCSHL